MDLFTYDSEFHKELIVIEISKECCQLALLYNGSLSISMKGKGLST